MKKKKLENYVCTTQVMPLSQSLPYIKFRSDDWTDGWTDVCRGKIQYPMKSNLKIKSKMPWLPRIIFIPQKSHLQYAYNICVKFQTVWYIIGRSYGNNKSSATVSAQSIGGFHAQEHPQFLESVSKSTAGHIQLSVKTFMFFTRSCMNRGYVYQGATIIKQHSLKYDFIC